jgi:choline monooxygenase
MFVHATALPHVLPPSAYSDAAVFAAEQKQLLRPSWQFVALRQQQLARPGDQVVRELHGVPVVVRNDAGVINTFVNVCAHRHAMLAAPSCKHQGTLTCQYHGWQYDDDGALKKLPDGRSFAGLDARALRLKKLRTEVVGELVFASLADHNSTTNNDDSAGFIDGLGAMGAEFVRCFGDHWPVRTWVTEHDVNWKVIVENAVESYHVPAVHPHTFTAFRAPELHEHTLHERYTRYVDNKPWDGFAGFVAQTLAKLWLPQPTLARFTHTHVFPTTLLYYGDLVSTVVSLEPLGPTRTRQVAVSFLPKALRSSLWRPVQWAFGRTFAALGERILREDMAAWPSIQQGLMHSTHEGVLSCREERVYAFQQYVAAGIAAAQTSTDSNSNSNSNIVAIGARRRG